MPKPNEANPGDGNNTNPNAKGGSTGADLNKALGNQPGAGDEGNGGDRGTQNAGGNQNGGDGDPGDHDNPNWDDATKKYIEKLRKENGKYRNTAKQNAENLNATQQKLEQFTSHMKKALGLEEEGEEITPEVLEGLEAMNQQASFDNGLLKNFLERKGLLKEFKYFHHLVNSGLEELHELHGDEMEEDGIQGVFDSAYSDTTNLFVAGAANNGNTSVNSNNPSPKGGAGGKGDVGLDAFLAMNTGEKSALYQKDPQTYNRLMAEAKSSKRSIVQL